MRIIVEDTETEIDLPEGKTPLKQVIGEVENFLFEVGKIPIALTIDGEHLTQEDLQTREEMELTGDETLVFGVMSIGEFLKGNLDGASQANSVLIKNINTFAEEMHVPSKTIQQGALIEELSNFFDFWFKLSTLLPQQIEQLNFGGKNFKEQFDGLRALFEEIVKAMEAQDFVLAVDLLRYEVIPAIEVIDKTIPSLKTILESLEAEHTPTGVE